MQLTLKRDIGFNKEELMTTISNAIFDISTSGDNRKLGEMTLWDVNERLSRLIADEIIEKIQDVIVLYDD